MADELPTGALVVVVGKDGERLHWEAKWRWRSRQVKRRLGRAHVAPRATPLASDGDERVEGWRARYAPRRGRSGSGSLTPEAALHAMREAIRSHAEEVEAAERAAERGGPVTFGRVADDWLAERRAEVRDGELKGSTVRDYASMLRRADQPLRRRGRGRTAHIMRAFDSRPVDAVDADEIDAWLRKLRAAGLSPGTRKKYEVVVSLVLDFAVRRRLIDANPMTGRPRPKRKQTRKPAIQVYTIETVEQIAREAEESFGEAIRLAALTGLRQGELLGLRWRDINWEGQSITVRHRYLAGEGEDVPKSGKARTVPLSDQAAAVLDRISRREHFTGRGDLVLANELGDHTDPSTLRRAYVGARDAVLEAAAEEGDDLPRLTFHGLRHCFGSRCVAAGVPLASIQAWMGHADITTTMVYVHFMPHADDAARLPQAFSSGRPVDASQRVIER
jgi:integrase